MTLESIRTLKPAEVGGRIARKGFEYQDHIAVKFLLDILSGKPISEIWIEGEDDIVLLYPNGKNCIVEMVQVKSNDLDSRWTVPKMYSLELLAKSISRGRCDEQVTYRIITCTDVDPTLSFLKTEISDKARNNTSIPSLIKTHKSKLALIPANLKGENVSDWFSKCVWQVNSKLEGLRAENIIYLEKCLHEKYNLILAPDQKIEIYQKLLSFTSSAGVGDNKHHFTDDEIIAMFDKMMAELAAPLKGTEKLKKKLAAAKLPKGTLEAAKEFRWQFEMEVMNHNFYGQSQINLSKNRIHILIQDLKLAYDNGDKFDIDGKFFPITSDSQFHKYCWDQVKILALELHISEEIALGCMYDNANRCTHRFTKASI
ncbi:dsDNA nuclease domain-containing protein [Pedobacter sp. GR22-10]|uniref:dsDNA nuclease domain-containing protein n=1 Tax=Pedobacter sp. GR22-10 TaxID=2994472 RepID=UPI0022467F3B|nr:dsDNA nuclease domain-containing protein [Pedobacter sp. GR22-10]MCX2432825.1 dsDNA nuclease domain-containing protein [Pedobacter sp. GR22-10]